MDCLITICYVKSTVINKDEVRKPAAERGGRGGLTYNNKLKAQLSSNVEWRHLLFILLEQLWWLSAFLHWCARAGAPPGQQYRSRQRSIPADRRCPPEYFICSSSPFQAVDSNTWFEKAIRAGAVTSSVAEPGCWSRIRLFSILDPGSRIRIKEFKYFNPKKTKKWFLSSKKYDPGCSSRIPDPDADFLPIPDPGCRGQKGTRSRIRNTGDETGRCPS